MNTTSTDAGGMSVADLRDLLGVRGTTQLEMVLRFPPLSPDSVPDDEAMEMVREAFALGLGVVPEGLSSSEILDEVRQRVGERRSPYSKVPAEPGADEGWGLPERDVIAGLVCALEFFPRIAQDDSLIASICIGVGSEQIRDRHRRRRERWASHEVSSSEQPSPPPREPRGGSYLCSGCQARLSWDVKVCPACDWVNY